MPLGRLSELQKEEISTLNKACVPWCLQGSIWTMEWIFEPGGLMTYPQPSHLLCYPASLTIFINSRSQEYLEGPHPSRWMRACGASAGHFPSQMHQVHLTMMVWPPRCQLVKGRSWKMNLMVKERAQRISLFSSLTRKK